MFKILNIKGRVLCYQQAANASQAVEFARMYGHRGAVRAEQA